MSHIVSISTQVRDLPSIAAACYRMSLPAPVQGSAQLFSGQATGVIVRLPDWQYPVVFNLESGEARYDNYGGKWGDQRIFDQFIQLYAVERAKMEARKKGYSVTEQSLRDGSIRVQIVAT
jgi:hypothetical protein